MSTRWLPELVKYDIPVFRCSYCYARKREKYSARLFVWLGYDVSTHVFRCLLPKQNLSNLGPLHWIFCSYLASILYTLTVWQSMESEILGILCHSSCLLGTSKSSTLRQSTAVTGTVPRFALSRGGDNCVKSHPNGAASFFTLPA